VIAPLFMIVSRVLRICSVKLAVARSRNKQHLGLYPDCTYPV
jgi:hypothetical protein